MIPTKIELINEGYICQNCKELIDGDDPGHPRYCEDCEILSYKNKLQEKEDTSYEHSYYKLKLTKGLMHYVNK